MGRDALRLLAAGMLVALLAMTFEVVLILATYR